VQVTGCGSQVPGYRLQVAGCGLRVAGSGLQVAGCRSAPSFPTPHPLPPPLGCGKALIPDGLLEASSGLWHPAESNGLKPSPLATGMGDQRGAGELSAAIAGAVDEAVVPPAEGEGAALHAVKGEVPAAANRPGGTGHGEEVAAAELLAGPGAAAAGPAFGSGSAETWHKKPPAMEEEQ